MDLILEMYAFFALMVAQVMAVIFINHDSAAPANEPIEFAAENAPTNSLAPEFMRHESVAAANDDKIGCAGESARANVLTPEIAKLADCAAAAPSAMQNDHIGGGPAVFSAEPPQHISRPVSRVL